MLFLLFVFTCSFQSDMIIIYWIKCKLQKAELDLKITNEIWDGKSFGIVFKVTLSMRGSKKAGGRGVENSNVFTSHCKVTQLPRPKISTGKRSC